jgi:hypothetical protein
MILLGNLKPLVGLMFQLSPNSLFFSFFLTGHAAISQVETSKNPSPQ